MDVTSDTVAALSLLLPGFITVGVSRSLSVEESKNDVDKFIRALTYSFVVFGIFSVFRLFFTGTDQLPGTDQPLQLTHQERQWNSWVSSSFP